MDRRATLLLSAGHLFTDLNQGAMPALLPFFVAEYHLSYREAAGLVFAATIASSVVQPLFGRYADRSRAAWLMPAGVFLAGLGLALTGVVREYWLMALVLSVSGLGVAAFHPEAARSMNAAAGPRKATGMSVFSMGGTAGFALGPLLVTGLMLAFGLRGTVLLAMPALGMALVLLSQLRVLPALGFTRPYAVGGAVDAWRPFGVLAAAIIIRSAMFFGFSTFLPLYWLDVLGQTPAAAGSILSLWLGSGVIGSLIGGRLADRYGAQRVGLVTSLLIVPLIILFVMVQQPLVGALLLMVMSILLAAPGSGLMVLGQGYLPNHVGVASGVTIGLSVSVGGATAPLLGWLADNFGIPTALASLAVMPLAIAVLLWMLRRYRPVL